MTDTKALELAIFQAIESYNTIIIHRHVRPDPDALGSQGALASVIRATYKDKAVYTVGEGTADLPFMQVESDDISEGHYQQALVIVCDSANQERIDDQRYLLAEKIIKIDHHPNTDPYGDISWVDPSMSSASEMVAKWCKDFEDQLIIPQKAAQQLYYGIIGDTGRFLYDATSDHTFEMAAYLKRKGADPASAGRDLDQISPEVAQLLAYVLEEAKISPNGLAYVTLTESLLRRFKVSEADSSQIVPYLGKISTVKAWIVFVQQKDGSTRCRMRSKGVVINDIASQFRGGGHPLASGAKVLNDEEKRAIIKAVDKKLAQEV
ncbi:bifunctional oligoribonuclease/PAP phosphatase NrnA [Atopobacter sp. AH10]|uniref:DHH family phosphoesterase n=1 Tax=Atopobacter sp. AH10 TaxID=2315861 RepID=UPI000EF18BF1|nr:bifunctional oligoribonuclease/PAP phosphatase NrnA [Atopobacter sp. AH10]RLK63256.1 bifunctional oligoribonuclease/PAP phosphatase NrnA [Atopobacter sp. AH10]